MRGPSLRFLEALPHIRCPSCKVHMDRENLHYCCPRCQYAFDVDAEKKLPVFPDEKLGAEEIKRRHQVMEQFHSLRWSLRQKE